MGLVLKRYVGESIEVADLYLITLHSVSGTSASLAISSEKNGTTRLVDLSRGESFQMEDGIRLTLVKINGTQNASIGCIAPLSLAIGRFETSRRFSPFVSKCHV
jgi:sRNA-binding carbon storage regulator CsrA